MDAIFKALGDPQRRKILDLLKDKDGRTLSELETYFPEITRFGVMKHLKVLEDSLLVSTKKEGRFKYHFLNPVPIQHIADRWISSFAAPWAKTMAELTYSLERTNHMTTHPSKPKQVYVSIIKTSPEKLWDALTSPKHTPFYYYGAEIKSDLKVGSDVVYAAPNGPVFVTGKILEATAPHKLVTSFEGHWDPSMAGDMPSRVTWEIKQEGDFCRLTLTHDEFSEENATYRNTSGGWVGILSGLKTYLETGKALGYNPMAA